MTRVRALTAGLCLLLAACAAEEPLEFPGDVSIEVGRPFPDLVLPALDDAAPASLARFRGKKVLLHVFASW